MICGPNGSGKTTLLRVLSTAMLPSAGTLDLFGGVSREAARARLGLLSHADYHYDDLSALENLLLAARISPRATDPLQVLARVGLQARAHDRVRTFSAGMRKRLALARVLWKAPDLVLLDEPYGQLDPAGMKLIDGLIDELRATGTTLLISTHQVARVAPRCGHALLLQDGRKIWSGPAPEATAQAAQLFGITDNDA